MKIETFSGSKSCLAGAVGGAGHLMIVAAFALGIWVFWYSWRHFHALETQAR